MADNFSKTAIITVEIVIKNMLRNGWIYIFSSNSTVFPLICMGNTCQIIWVSVARGSGCPCCTFQSTFLAVIIMSNVNTKTFIELIQILCQLLCGIWNIREMQHTLSEVWFFFHQYYQTKERYRIQELPVHGMQTPLFLQASKDGDQENAAANRGKILVLRRRIEELESQITQKNEELQKKVVFYMMWLFTFVL